MSLSIRGPGYLNINTGSESLIPRKILTLVSLQILIFVRLELWGADIEFVPSVHYDEIMANDEGVAAWTDRIVRYSLQYNDYADSA